MLSLSNTTGYAIRALSCLKGPEEKPVLVKDLARMSDVSNFYLAKIVSRLSESGLLKSKRGYKGGVQLARPPQDISLLDVSQAIDGDDWLNGCLLGMAECSDERACPHHAFWKECRAEIRKNLAETSLKDAADFEARLAARRSRRGA
jgi:Rrf2 family protein